MKNNSSKTSEVIFRDLEKQYGFTQVSNLVIEDSSLSDLAIRIYFLLTKYAMNKGFCFPGQDRLARDIGKSRSSISRGLAELKVKKLISWKNRGLNKTNLYIIEPISEIYSEKLQDKFPDVSNLQHPDVSPMKHQGVSPVTHKEYKEEKEKIKNIKLTFPPEADQPLAENVNGKFSSFSGEALQLAKEFNDLKSINYYQKIVSQKDKGEINADDFYSALTFIRDQINIQQKDGLSTIKNQASLFVKRLNELIEKRKQSKQQESYQKQLSKLSEKMKF